MTRIDPENFREVGRIVGAHGIQGAVKVAPETDDPNRVIDLPAIYLGLDVSSSRRYEIKSGRIQPSKYGPTIVLELEGVLDRQMAKGLSKHHVYALETDLPPLSTDEYYLSDLIGLDVVEEEGNKIGRVVDVLELPGQNVLKTRTVEGREILIPAVSEFIKEIDFDNRNLIVSLIDGMLD